MEAAGAPRLDVERPFKKAGPPLNAGRWSAWANAAGQEWALLPSYAVALAEGRSARLLRRALGHLRARDAGVLSSPSDPS
jgi:hypothetical protein